MAGRPTKLGSKLQTQIVRLLCAGISVSDTCAFVGIAKSTFYDWIERGSRGEAEFSEFSDAVSRAYEAAKVTAIQTVHESLSPTKVISRSTDTFTETRVNSYGKEYVYKQVRVRETVTTNPGDWRAAIEFLKRRFPDEWGDRQKIEDWRTQAIADIRAGKIPYEALADAFDTDLATELFAAAGVPVQAR